MQNDQDKASSSEEGKKHLTSFEQEHIDWCLAFYIDMVEVNKSDIATPVTLFIPGMLITGTIISAAEYMKTSGLNDLWTKLVGESDEQVAFQPRHFIHLKDARFYMSAQELANSHQQGVLWRGQLSSISGFCIRNLTGTMI